MTTLTQYGQQVTLLSDHVRKFNLKQGNTKGVHFLKSMEFARWAWKELFRTTIWEIKVAVLHVDPTSHTIQLPGDIERLVNISVMDRFGKIQPLTYNPNMSTVDILCQKNTCSCSRCHGHNSLCSAIDNISVTQETIEINGQDYTKITYIKTDDCGNIQKQEEVPTWDAAEEEVTMVTVNTQLCKVELDSRGCIKPTAPNIAMLQTYCGYGAYLNNGWTGGLYNTDAYRSLIPTPYNFYGYWNWNAASRDIIHIFRSVRTNRIYANCPTEVEQTCFGEENAISKVIVSYQSSAESDGEELLIPDYAAMAVDAGIIYQQRLFNPKDGDRDRSGEMLFNRKKKDVTRYLNPIRMDDIRKIQTQLRPW